MSNSFALILETRQYFSSSPVPWKHMAEQTLRISKLLYTYIPQSTHKGKKRQSAKSYLNKPVPV